MQNRKYTVESSKSNVTGSCRDLNNTLDCKDNLAPSNRQFFVIEVLSFVYVAETENVFYQIIIAIRHRFKLFTQGQDDKLI